MMLGAAPSAGSNKRLRLPALTAFLSLLLQQNEAKEEEERRTKDLSEEEVRKRIEEYNSQDSENGMKLVSF